MFAAGEWTVGIFEPEAGYVRPERAVAAQLALALRHGARLHLDERVGTRRRQLRDVTVTTDLRPTPAQRLLLCTGAWIGDLVPAMHDLVAIYRQLLFWFRDPRALRRAVTMSASCGIGRRYAAGLRPPRRFYGFPAIDGPGGGVRWRRSGMSTRPPPTAPSTRRRHRRPSHVPPGHRAIPPWLRPEPLGPSPACTPAPAAAGHHRSPPRP